MSRPVPEVPPEDRLLLPSEAAAMLRVDPKTISRWAIAGKITDVRTPGGRRRVRESEVLAIFADDGGGTGAAT